MSKKSTWYEVYDPYMNGYAMADDGRNTFIRIADAQEWAEEWHRRTGRRYEVHKVEKKVDVVFETTDHSEDKV